MVLLVCIESSSQNLVPNPSFEDYLDCPDYWGAMADVEDWTSCGFSPDYFNGCRDSADVGVPFNVVGFQYAADGAAYCGVVTYDSTSSTIREIICAELDQPLIGGLTCYASMKVSPGGFGSGLIGSSPGFTSKGVGFRVSMGPISWPQPFPNDAVIYLDSVLVDTAGWTTISGSFVPDSNYTHILIGNFFNDSLSSPERLDVGGDILGYAFVDEVCLSHQEWICMDENSVIEIDAKRVQVYPNPFSSNFTIELSLPSSSPVTVDLIDMAGRICYTNRFKPGMVKENLFISGVEDGQYTLRLRDADNGVSSIHVTIISD